MTQREKEQQKIIDEQGRKLMVQDRLIESLMEYVREISPREPEAMHDRRRAARTVIHGENL